jgi:hypothetical protein
MFKEDDFEIFAETEPNPCKACNTNVSPENILEFQNKVLDFKNKVKEAFDDKLRILGDTLIKPVLLDRFGVKLRFQTEQSSSYTMRPFYYATWAKQYDGIRRAQINIMLSDDIKPEDNNSRTRKLSVKFCLYNKCKPGLPKNEDFDNFVENIRNYQEIFLNYLEQTARNSFELYNNEGFGYCKYNKPLAEFKEDDVFKYFVDGPNTGCTFQELRKNYYFYDNEELFYDGNRFALILLRDIVLLYPIFLFADARKQNLIDRLNEFSKAVSMEESRNVNIWNQTKIDEITIPQIWGGFCDMVDRRKWDLATVFLDSDTRPLLSDLTYPHAYNVLEKLQDLFTNPKLESEPALREVAEKSMWAFIEDFVRDRSFPIDGHTDIYWGLFQLWTEHKINSVSEVDWQLLLTLAHAVLLNRSDEQWQIVSAIQDWWHARKSVVLVPFVIEALDLLGCYISDRSVLGNLLNEIASFIREDPSAYSPEEKSILRRIGKSIGFEDEDIGKVLGITETVNDEAEDILAHTKLDKIAIVSLQEGAASSAASIIRERSGASVNIVSEKVAGNKTKGSKNADVIIFVWAANKHAVYRVFDDVREKIAYASSVGKQSIILALERWVVRQKHPIKA